MPVVKNVSELQNVLKQWMRQPNESDEEYRKRINDPANEISFDLFGLRNMVTERIEDERFQCATPAIPVDLEVETKAGDTLRSFWDKAKEIDVILTDANKGDDEDA